MSVTSTRTWAWFAAWLAVGGGFAFGLIGILSIGVFMLPVAALGLVVLVGRPGAGRGLPGLICGLGLAPLFVAYLNRDGPGDVCRAIAGGVACEQEWSPWPWLAVGVGLMSAGIAWCAAGRRSGGAGG